MKSIEHFLKKVPQKYLKNITIIGDHIGKNTKISFLNENCGCIQETTIYYLGRRIFFDICHSCYKKTIKPIEHYTNQIPQKYVENIIIENKYIGQNTIVKYKHPICECITESTLKVLCTQREQFDCCYKCFAEINKPIDYYLNKIPAQYHNNITIIGKYIGVKTNIIVKYNCGCEKETKLLHLTNRDSFDLCPQCIRKNNIEYYLDKIPKEYNNNISLLEKYRGNLTKVSFINIKCGCISETTLGYLIQKTQFDLCHKHTVSLDDSNWLNKITEKYHKYITYKYDVTKQNDRTIHYLNPGCGCISETQLENLSSRKQFDYCNKCENSLRKLSYKDFFDKIPKQYIVNINFIGEDLGRKTDVFYSFPNCKCVRQFKFNTLFHVFNFEKCTKCTGSSNQLTQQQMIDNLILVDNTKIISGYPGNRSTIISCNCKKCGKEIESTYFRLLQYYNYYNKAQCKNCCPKNMMQQSIYEFVKTLIPSAEQDNRNVIKSKYSNNFMELDIYCRNNNFAIEFNGLIWHSEKYKGDRAYHDYKTSECLNKHITLFHMWEDKLIKHKDIYENMIKSKLGFCKKIKSSDITIKQVSLKDSKIFFRTNHLCGNSKSLMSFGVYYDNQLIQCLSVTDAKIEKYKKYIKIARFATAKDYIVEDNENKLLKYIEMFYLEKYSGIIHVYNSDYENKIIENQIKITKIQNCYTDGKNRISNKNKENYKCKLYKVYLSSNNIYLYNFNLGESNV